MYFKSEAVKSLVETYSRMFSMPVTTVGEATEEEIVSLFSKHILLVRVRDFWIPQIQY